MPDDVRTHLGSSRFKVDQLRQGEPDARGALVEHIYALRSGEYAVYRAGSVYIQFADDPGVEREQRARVLAIGEHRADLAALLVGWALDRRAVYDCKIAMGLQLALDGNEEAARKTLEGARADVLKEREAAGRLQYLACAAACGVVLLLALALLHAGAAAPASAADDFLLAGQAGLAGAMFSIALAIRSRTVALDTDIRGNASEGLLRLVIGLASGALILLLLTSGILPQLAFGEVGLSAENLTWKGVAVVAFLAGFAERLIPDILDKAYPQPVGAPSPIRP